MNRNLTSYAVAAGALLAGGLAHAQAPANQADTPDGIGAGPRALAACPYDPAEAIYVDDDNSGGTQDGSPEHPYAGIQQAIDAADPNATIIVRAGDYFESIDIHESMQLIGAGASQTRIHGCDDDWNYAVYVGARDVRMCGFAISGCPEATDSLVVIRDDGFAMRSCTVTDGDYRGVDLEGVERCHIESCRILRASIVVEHSRYNTIAGNEITAAPYYCIGIRDGSQANEIRGNTISQADYYAIWLWSDSFDNVIQGNLIHNNGNGLGLTDSHLNTISGNTFANNEFDGVYIDNSGGLDIRNNTFSAGGGIRFSRLDRDPWDWTTNTISGNTVEGAPIYYYNGASNVTVPTDAAQVIMTNCTNMTISDLTLDKAACPIEVSASSYVSIRNNRVHSEWYATGVLMVGSQHNEISGNSFESTYTAHQYGQASGIEAISITDGSDDLIADNTIVGFNLGIGRWNWRPTANNTIRDNDIASWNYGIQIHSYHGAVANTSISGNHITGGAWAGMIVSGWPGLSVTDNTFVDSGLRLSAGDPNEWRTYEIVNNTVNGKPLYYFADETDLVTPTDAGQMILFNCDNPTVSGLDIASTSVGITAAFCRGGEISANRIGGIGSAGILLKSTPDMRCVDNDISGYERSIRLTQRSDRALVAGNRIEGAFAQSIDVEHCADVVVDANLVEQSGDDISPYPQNGIQINWVTGSTISDNTVRCIASSGISVSDSSTGNLFVGNSVAQCRTALNFSVHSGSNQVYENQFIDLWQRAAGEYDESGNTWTGPAGGNYWADFAENPGYPDYYLVPGSEAGTSEQSRDIAPLPERIRAPYACGDVDESCGPVNIADLGQFLACFSQQPADDCANADLDGNGAIDLSDLGLMLQLFGSNPPCQPPDCAKCIGG